jgi:type VI secretion system secreted protein Hcp
MKTMKPVSKCLLSIATASTLLLTPLASQAAVDMFLLLDGIQGETQDSSYNKEGGIDVLAWSTGLSQSGTTHVGGSAGVGRTSVQDLSLTNYLDSSSPALRLLVANGRTIDTATLIVRKAGDNQLEYFRIDLKNIIVSSISSGGSGGEDRLTENVSLNFSEIRWTYTPQNRDGSAGTQITAGWNILENKEL